MSVWDSSSLSLPLLLLLDVLWVVPFHPGQICFVLCHRITCIFILGWFLIQVEVGDPQSECVLTAQVGLTLGPRD